MGQFYSYVFLVISIMLTVILAGMWRKRFDVNLALIFIFVNISNLGHVFFYSAEDLDEALVANKIMYLGGCFLPLMVFFLVLRLCRIRVPKWLKAYMVAESAALFGCTLTIGYLPIYYREVHFAVTDGLVHLEKVYGPIHMLFNVALITYFLLSIIILGYTFVYKKDVSHKIVALLLIPAILCISGFWIARYTTNLQPMPFLYDLSLVVYLIIARKIGMYDIIDTGIDSLVEEGDTGFISLDNKLNYLGSNDTAARILPDIERVRIDTCIKDYRLFEDTLLYWLAEFNDEDHDGVIRDQFVKEVDGRYYYVNVSYLFDGKRRCGYQFFFLDNTKEQLYIDKINSYNDDLQREVDEKTAHIVEMHNRLIMGMATMVESRDNSTGGHVRRTSDLVRMLIDEIRKDNDLDLSEKFCRDLIKAAPMHDLGKIAVDDSILRKPGRFEDWEFEKMKAHASEGARIVHEILKGTDDEEFHQLAENVAHYHHERWDGSGYPEGLRGEDIPLEARIMAIADVYDALVSRRVYKEKMSFEQADGIIMEGMGRHFDKQLEQYYVAARPRFEAYYTELEKEEAADKEDHAELCS